MYNMYNQVVLDKIDRYFLIKNAIKSLTHSCIFYVVKLLLERQRAHAQTFDRGVMVMHLFVGQIVKIRNDTSRQTGNLFLV
jgi:hypothetical protein